MRELSFFVDGAPKPQARPRAFRRGKHIAMYSPKSDWKKSVTFYAGQHGHLNGSLKVELHFLFKRPKSHYRTGKNSHILKDSAPYDMTNKPDLDNLAKAIYDACQDGGLIADDSYIIESHCKKSYHEHKEGVQITFHELD